MLRPFLLTAAGAASFALAACSGGSAPAGPPPTLAAPVALPALPTPMPTQTGARSLAAAPNPIKHIVIVIQENRTFDNLFHGYTSPVDGPADYATSGQGKLTPTSAATTIPLTQVPFEEVYDPGHSFGNFVPEYDNGAMDGFYQQNQGSATTPGSIGNYGYAYLPQTEVQPYWDMASQGTLAQRFFHGFTGPTYPSHLVFVSGTTNGVSSNPTVQLGWGCFDQNPSDTTPMLYPQGPPPNGYEVGNAGGFPCYDNLTIADLLTRAGHTWHYYSGEPGMSPGGNLNGLASYRQDYYGKEWSTDAIFPETRILADVGTAAAPGTLADVTYVVPEGENSDHAQGGTSTGPQWVASVVNAIGQSSFYSSTAIFVTWDDWGGWYDHVVPPFRSVYGPGFRIPLILISPYAKHGRLNSDELEPGSILKFAEETFGLPSLHTSDEAAKNSASVMFDFTQTPAPFKPIASKLGKHYFLHEMKHSMAPVDDD